MYICKSNMKSIFIFVSSITGSCTVLTLSHHLLSHVAFVEPAIEDFLDRLEMADKVVNLCIFFQHHYFIRFRVSLVN
jgi:hypothetical protein